MNARSRRGTIKHENLAQFALGGDAVLTLENLSRGTHVTLWLQKADKDDPSSPLYARVFVGMDNRDRKHYRFVGTVWTHHRNGHSQRPVWRYSERSKQPEDSVGPQSFKWLVEVLRGEREIPECVRVWHEGRCCFCHRPLTQPASVRHGYGPDCADQRDLPYGRQSRRRRSA